MISHKILTKMLVFHLHDELFLIYHYHQILLSPTDRTAISTWEEQSLCEINFKKKSKTTSSLPQKISKKKIYKIKIYQKAVTFLKKITFLKITKIRNLYALSIKRENANMALKETAANTNIQKLVRS